MHNRLSLSRFLLTALSLCTVIFLAGAAKAQNPVFEEGNRLVKTSLIADRAVFQPSATGAEPAARIGILFEVQPGWHIYWKNSGEAAIPTEIEWQLPSGWKTGELQWPVPLKFAEKGDITTYGYRREVLLFADLMNPPEISSAGEKLTISAKVSWLVCSEVCVPGERTVSETFESDTSKPLQPSEAFTRFQEAEALAPKRFNGKLSASLSMPLVEGAESTLEMSFPYSELGPSIETLTDSDLQFFPTLSDSLTVRRIGLRKSEDRSLHLLAALQREKSEAESESNFVGVLAIKRGNQSPLVYEVMLPLSQAVAPESSRRDSTLSVEETWKAAQDLKFRLISHDLKSENPEEGASFSVTQFLIALLSAFGAGLILNCMPCVLPVLSLKVLSFVQHPGDTPLDHRRSAIFYSLGVLFAFLVLAIAVILLKSYGMQIGWGFQFQYPGFVFGLALVVFILSLSFFDLYSVSLPGVQRANRFVSALDHEGAGRHFFDGVLATALSTPCSAPLLGTALAFAFTQSAVVTVLVFLSIGCGLALPYLLIATNERFIHYLPRPGLWMEKLRQLFGFLLLGTVLWLLFVLQSLQPSSLVPTLGLFLLGAFFLWIRKLFTSWRKVPDALLLAIFSFLVWSVFPGEESAASSKGASVQGTEIWAPFNADDVQSKLAEGRSVFIDFTADWCITCKFNEKLVLHTEEMQSLFAEHKVALFKGDWTRKDPAITEELTKYGGRGVPFYVVLKPGKDAIVLPTLLTASSVKQSLK